MSGQDYEQLTLYPEDSHASPFPWLESKKAKGTTVTYGLRCCELSESCARVASSVRMFLESSRLPPGRWSRISGDFAGFVRLPEPPDGCSFSVEVVHNK